MAHAENVVVSEATDRNPVATHARNLRLRSLIVQIAVTLVLATVVFVRLESPSQFLIVVAVLAVVGAVATLIARILSRDDAAKNARWAKVFPTVSVEQDGKRRAHTSVSVLVTDAAVVVRRRTSSRFAAATYTTVIETPWSKIDRIEYSPSRLGWWYPVIIGPDIAIAAAGTVGSDFRSALQELGASIS